MNPSPFKSYINAAEAAKLTLPSPRTAEDQLELLDSFCFSLHHVVHQVPAHNRPSLAQLDQPVQLNARAKVERKINQLARLLKCLRDGGLKAQAHAASTMRAFAASTAGKEQTPEQAEGLRRHMVHLQNVERFMRDVEGLKRRLAELHKAWGRGDPMADPVHTIQLGWARQAAGASAAQRHVGFGQQRPAHNWFIREGDISNGVRHPYIQDGKSYGVDGSKEGDDDGHPGFIPLPSFALPQDVAWL